MKDIVEEALEKSSAMDTEESDISPPNTFGLPRCAVVGCGPKGISRLERFIADDSIDLEVTTIAVGRTSTLESATTTSAETVQIPIAEEPTNSPRIDTETFEDRLRGQFNDLNIIVVTGHLDSIASARSIEIVCKYAEDATSDPVILAAPTIPSHGLCKDLTQVFFNIVRAAGTTIPYDHGWILNSHPQVAAGESSEPTIEQTIDSIMTEWFCDVFEPYLTPTESSIDYAAVRNVLRDGDVAILYRGEGSRSDDPDTLLDQAAASRVCDGDRSATDGYFGLIRFGDTYTLQELETFETRVVERFASAGTEQPYHRLVCGKSDSRMGDQCRVALLLTGIDPESLSFIGD